MDMSIDSAITLNSGITMPRFGLGTYKSAPGTEVEHSVEFALRHGYRALDTASMYGNEEGVGEGIRRSGLDRSDVFVTTKVWNDEQGYDETLAALDRSLSRLGTDYVDLYLVHWPMREHMEGTWRAMEELLGAGRTRAIGVCNHLQPHLEALLAIAEVPPAVDQVEFHPWLQQPELQAFLAENDIALECWAPVMRGHAPEVDALVAAGAAHGKSPEQVAIRWSLQKGNIVIPKSVHDARILENADVFDFELTTQEMAEIDEADRGHRFGPDPHKYAW